MWKSHLTMIYIFFIISERNKIIVSINLSIYKQFVLKISFEIKKLFVYYKNLHFF